jgi:ferric-dicitrate binding protein FerR (iron transport regulator)
MSITCFSGPVEEARPRSGGKHHCHGTPQRRSERGLPQPEGAVRDTISQMQPVDPNRDSTPAADLGSRPVPLPRRVAAFLVLIALLAAAALSSWWILSGQVDFFAADGRRAPATADEELP